MHSRSSLAAHVVGAGEMVKMAPLPPPQSLPSLNTLLRSLDPAETQHVDGEGRGLVPLACLPVPAWKKALDPFTPG